MIFRLLRRLASADALGSILILAAMQSFTYGISSSLRNTDTRYFFWVCLIAVLIALGLNKLELNGDQGSALLIMIGALGIWIIAARLLIPLFDLGSAFLSLTPQIIPAIRFHLPIDTSALIEPWRAVLEASSILGVRVRSWLISIIEKEVIDDGLVRSMAWMLIVWLMAAWMGWFAGRRNAIASLLPSILLLAAVASYSEHRVYTLWVMVSVLLLLMGIWNYKNHITHWEKKKVDYSESIRYDVSQSVIFLTVVIGAIAFITPSVSWREIRDLLRQQNQSAQNRTADILGIRQAPASTKKVATQKPALPRDHLLSEGYAQSQKIVMTIRTGELPPIVGSISTADPPRYYWRSVTYDTYVGAGWVTSAAPAQEVRANTPLIPGLLDGYKLLHVDVQMVKPEGHLFWSGILFSADVPFTANWRVRPGSSLFADRAALLQADMFAALSKTQAYQARSYVPLVSVKQLREASGEYPEEIQKRYLQLPEVSPRVRQLAEAITQGKATAYDKARAIETYLRETYPYDLDIPTPPEDTDVADYFLFDLRRGYCDYYATAMVVLARFSGLPARFVSGYSSGSYDAPNAQYVVREMNAHSWAEIYFPEIGWVEFEPTASQPEIDRPAVETAPPSASADESSALDLLYCFRVEKAAYWLSPIAGIVVLLLSYFTLIERWWLLQLAPETAIERVYRRLYRLGRPLAGEHTPAETAYEFMGKLTQKLESIRGLSPFRKMFLNSKQDIEYLTGVYYTSLFSRKELQRADAYMALNVWKRLRLRLMLARSTTSLNHVFPRGWRSSRHDRHLHRMQSR